MVKFNVTNVAQLRDDFTTSFMPYTQLYSFSLDIG